MVIINDFPLNAEYWRAVDGFPNYEVSSDGRVRNSHTGLIRKLQVKPGGHIYIALTKDKQALKRYVHILVAHAFCNRNDDCNIVDHIDRNPANNNYHNLRWVTQSINLRNYTSNRSEHQGVSYERKPNTWVACWNDQNMTRQRKRFSVKKLGYEQAKEMAIDHRRIMALENGYLNP